MKKRVLALLLCLVTLLTFTACSFSKILEEAANSSAVETASPNPEETTPGETASPTDENAVRPISLSTGSGHFPTVYGDSYDVIMKASYPVMQVSYGDTEKFPALSAALEERTADARENMVEYIDTSKETAMQQYEDYPAYFNPYEAKNEVTVKRADTLVTSLLFSAYAYSGGAHGNFYLHGETYDTETGKKLTLSDVVKDTAALAPAIRKELDTFWDDVEFFGDDNFDDIFSRPEELSWTVDYNGITFYFSPYVLAAYASGTQTVTLSNEEYPDILKDKYKEVPNSYGIELSPDVPLYYDVTGDGKIDEILFSAFSSDYSSSDAYITITVNDVPFKETLWFFEAHPTFVHTKDGENYIYAELYTENDYRDFVCFSVSDKVKKLHEISGGYRSFYRQGNVNIITKDVLTNPESFYIQRITQHISTASGYREYYVGKNGKPVSDSPMYVLEENDSLEFTLLQDLEADIYDEKTEKVNGKKTLKKGDKVIYCATDCEEYALLRAADGTLLRIQSVRDENEYRFTINGMKLEELFDGLFFAG